MGINEKQEEKIEQLYLEMYALLLSYANSILKNDSRAEEAVQETFRIACTKPNDLLSSKNPKGWLTNTLKNVLWNMRKDYAKTQKMVIGYIQEQEWDTIGDCDEIEVDILYSDLAGCKEYQLIKKIAFEHKSILEISRELGISVEACSKRIQRAKKRLRKKFKNYEK
ncbi:MAG: sigma-70 family RNA polymerase sigma factor [Eubacteriales bacterium]|nr:sigma-70 family RNA polymerase sigma factor [Eubacteriales bacterium]